MSDEINPLPCEDYALPKKYQKETANEKVKHVSVVDWMMKHPEYHAKSRERILQFCFSRNPMYSGLPVSDEDMA